MAFLYIGLGLAMISGISAMMQIGNNINNLSLLSSFKDNEYYQSSSVMTFIGWMLVIILFIVNLNSTFVLLLVSTN